MKLFINSLFTLIIFISLSTILKAQSDIVAERWGSTIIMDYDCDGVAEYDFKFGNGDSEDQYLAGDWDGDGKDNIGIRRGNKILLDYDNDGVEDFVFTYGSPNETGEYFVGDWDGDGRDNIGIRRDKYFVVDYDFNSARNREFRFGYGNSEDQYLVGDWNGNGKDNVAVRRGNELILDYDFEPDRDLAFTFGNGNSEDEYLAGDFNGDGLDDFAYRRGNTFCADLNKDGTVDNTFSCGMGTDYLVGDWEGKTQQVQSFGLEMMEQEIKPYSILVWGDDDMVLSVMDVRKARGKLIITFKNNTDNFYLVRFANDRTRTKTLGGRESWTFRYHPKDIQYTSTYRFPVTAEFSYRMYYLQAAYSLVFTEKPPTTIFDGIVSLIAQATNEDLVTAYTGYDAKWLAQKFAELIVNDATFRKRLAMMIGKEGSENWIKSQAETFLVLTKVYSLAEGAYWWINSSFPPDFEKDHLKVQW